VRYGQGDGLAALRLDLYSWSLSAAFSVVTSHFKATELKPLRIAAGGHVIVPPRVDEFEGRPQPAGSTRTNF
jgi:hypothetical protein